MNGSLDSPRVTPRRQISACLAVLAGGVFLLGCGSSGEEPSISQEDADALNSRLDAIREDADQKDCTGSSTVFTRLTATREQVDASDGINEQAKNDLNELLDNLEGKVQEECDAVESSSTTSDSTSTKEDTTTTEESTTTEETTDSSTTTDKPEEPSTPTPPETSPGGGNGPPSGTPPAGGGTGGESGGVGPGFESGRNSGG